MSAWTDAVMSQMYPWPIGVLVSASAVSLLFGVIGVWSLFRVRELLRVVPAVEDRLNTLANSVSMLTDTTESCFKALAMQLQYEQAQRTRTTAPASAPARSRGQNAEPSSEAATRKSRQRRVVGAARRGETLADIAAREDVAEGEVALRLHVNRESATTATTTETKRYGSMLT